MRYRKLGKSGLEISEVGFGCMSLGSNQSENETLIHSAIDAGINYFDTADFYAKGENEISVGKALRGRRDKIILASKVGNQWRADGSGWDWNASKKYILACIDESLRRLHVDYLDLYQLHGGTISDPIDDTIEAFEILRASGKIKAYGISSIRPNVIREYVKRSSIVSNMMQYSILDQRPEEQCLELLAGNGIGVLARGVLAQGLLIDKPENDYLGRSAASVKNIQKAIQSLAGRTSQEIALKFVLHSPTVCSVIVGFRNREQLESILQVASRPAFGDEEMEIIRRVAAPNFYEQHR